MALLHLSDHNFKQEVLASDLPVLVDFWATWCRPCQALAPLLEELSIEYKAKIKIGKIDVGASPQTATKYGIMSVPTLIFFKNGKVISQGAGAMSKAEIKRKIEEELL